ncbi:MAG: cell division protein FtsZ [Bacteroidales bacterium]|jgi:cell division protein FtsZ|nr:cell division protein FtsZ [Bacteroidales bacterium]
MNEIYKGNEFDGIDIQPASWVPAKESKISVIGVGGGGCNAVNYMFKQQVQGCNFIVCNTDSQALDGCEVPTKIQMGRGLGAGTNATAGRNAALDAQDLIASVVFGSPIDMLFITAGMGGGTGTGAAPVIAKMSRERGILTVAVVTLPFENEGPEALGRAIDGINELKKNVDSLLIINNEKLHEQFGKLLIQEAFPKADEVLATAVMSVVEIIKKKGYVNVDFEDVKTVMKDSGLALMGCGVGKGQNRIDDAIEAAINSPLLNDFEVDTAQKVLLNITVANNENGIEMDDLNTLTNKIRDALGKFTMFKRGIIWNDDPDADDTIRVTVVATGFEYNKLNKITNVDLGNLIILDNDYVFDKKRVMDSEEGRSLPATEGSVIQTIGFNTQSSHPVFDEQNKPVLLMENGEDFSTLENIPAIRRSIHNEK